MSHTRLARTATLTESLQVTVEILHPRSTTSKRRPQIRARRRKRHPRLAHRSLPLKRRRNPRHLSEWLEKQCATCYRATTMTDSSLSTIEIFENPQHANLRSGASSNHEVGRPQDVVRGSNISSRHLPNRSLCYTMDAKSEDNHLYKTRTLLRDGPEGANHFFKSFWKPAELRPPSEHTLGPCSQVIGPPSSKPSVGHDNVLRAVGPAGRTRSSSTSTKIIKDGSTFAHLLVCPGLSSPRRADARRPKAKCRRTTVYSKSTHIA